MARVALDDWAIGFVRRETDAKSRAAAVRLGAGAGNLRTPSSDEDRQVNSEGTRCSHPPHGRSRPAYLEEAIPAVVQRHINGKGIMKREGKRSRKRNGKGKRKENGQGNRVATERERYQAEYLR